MDNDPPPDLTRTTLQLLFVGALIAGAFRILWPFLIPLTWATTIAVSSWPLYERLLRAVGGRRGLAVAVMSLALLLVIVVPVYVAITTIVENTERIAAWSKELATLAVPQPPPWVDSVPVVGASLAARWRDLAATDAEEIAARVVPYARILVAWFAGQVGGIGLMVLEFLLTVVIAAILFANGEAAAASVDRFAWRLAGSRGHDAVHLAAQAVRAVALGVVVTALAQSCLGGVGLALAGLPFATILTAVMFVLGVAQIGPLPVLVPAVIWTYWHYSAGWGTFLLTWSLLVAVMDNFLRPVLIRRGADLPLMLIFAGVIGGLIAFGVIGLFIGPVVLAVAYTLLVAWVDDSGASSPPRDIGPPA